MRMRQVVLAGVVLAALAAAAAAEDASAPPANEKPAGVTQGPPGVPPAAPSRSPLGLFCLTGDAEFNFTAQRRSRGVFEGAAGPLLLWQPAERLLVELGLDLSLANNPQTGKADKSATPVHANISYIVNDRLVVGGGLFDVPFGAFRTHFDSSWINRLPDAPLPFGDGGIAPDTGVGVFAMGAFPAGDQRFTYNLWLVNGPTVITDDPDAAGSLDFENFHNFEYTSKSNCLRDFGGRVAWIPVPAFEIGYSIQYGRVNPRGFEGLHALLQGVDISFVKEFDEIKGTVRAQAEWIWSNVQDATYDPTGALKFGPLRFSNERNGGFALLSYRPTKCGNNVLRNTEFVIRYDRLGIPEEAPGGGNEERWTEGVDYWIAPSVVVKVAYEWDRKQGSPDGHALLFQFAVGF